MSDEERQLDEFEAIESIYPQEFTVASRKPFSGCLKISPSISKDEFTISVNTVLNKNTEKKVFSVKYLSPIELYFMCPSDYPSTTQPNFMLHCPWLSSDSLSKICNKFDILWDETLSEIIFIWACFLKDDLLSFLELNELEIYVNVDEVHETVDNKLNSYFADSTNIMEPKNCIKVKALHNKDFNLQKVRKRLQLKKNKIATNVSIRRSNNINIKQSSNDIAFKYETPRDIENKNKATNSSHISEKHNDVPCDFYTAEDNDDATNQTTSITECIFRVISVYGKRPKLKYFNIDQRIIPNVIKSNEIVNQLQNYNDTILDREFNTEIHCCTICLENKLGSQCVCVKPCRHAFCKDCVRSYLTINIMEAKVVNLRCLDPECETLFTDFQIRQNVDDVMFNKYRQFSLKYEIENSPQLIYCPRKICQSVARVTNIGDELGYCKRCSYYFCLFCKKAYHGIQACDFKNEEIHKIIREYQNGDANKRAALEKRFTKLKLEEWINAVLSEKWINEYSKPCPNCGVKIEKDQGCNKIVCYSCTVPFCWLCDVCLSRTYPYKHFLDPNSPCYQKLFPANELYVDEEEESEEEEEDEYDEFLTIVEEFYF